MYRIQNIHLFAPMINLLLSLALVCYFCHHHHCCRIRLSVLWSWACAELHRMNSERMKKVRLISAEGAFMFQLLSSFLCSKNHPKYFIEFLLQLLFFAMLLKRAMLIVVFFSLVFYLEFRWFSQRTCDFVWIYSCKSYSAIWKYHG